MKTLIQGGLKLESNIFLFQVDIVTANTYYDMLVSWIKLKQLIDFENRNEIGDYYENHKEWPQKAKKDFI